MSIAILGTQIRSKNFTKAEQIVRQIESAVLRASTRHSRVDLALDK